KETLTDESGAFELSRVKFYGNSVVYGKQTGYWTSLGLPGNKGIPITIRLTPIPRDFNSESGGLSGFFRGQSLIFPRNGDFASFLESRKESIAALRPQVLRLAGLESIANNQASVFAVIDRFIAFTKELGADPMIVIPTGKLQPQEASAWARYSNVEKNYGVRYWAIGDEPDLMLKGGGNLSGESNGLYDCINDFRTLYNALKTVDPNLVVLGPELAWKYSEGENDWLTPFLQYDGDIVNLISVHRYGCLADKPCSAKSIEENLRGEEAALWGISDKIAAQTDNFVPLVVTGGNSCLSFPVSAADEASPGGFEAALWMAEEMSILAQTGLGMGFLSSVKAEGTDGLFNGTGPQPVYWAQKLFGNAAKGKILDAQIPQADISLFATQEILSKDVRLLIVNKTDRYYHPKIYLNGKDGDLIVDAGLKQRVEYEIPSFSISCLKIKADNSPGEVVLYTRKLARADQAPVTSVLKPW
ncbi:MAG TPA: hypothetical protein VMV05_01000, partial [bacterium]|nr:hypothetical protein [bacterium]